MSEWRSWLDALRAEDLGRLSDAAVEDGFAEIQAACEALESERLRWLGEIERRRTYERQGHVSTAAWLASSFKVGFGRAREQVKTAVALTNMPKTRRALEQGDLSMSSVQVLAAAHDADPEGFLRCENELVQVAQIHSVRDLASAARSWEQSRDVARGADPEERLRRRRRLRTSVGHLGMVRVDGDLDPESGETLLTALQAVMDADARGGPGDARTPEQRRADALGEICRTWLDSAARPRVAGERPHITVTVDEAALRGEPDGSGGGGPDGVAAGDHTGPVPPGLARRLACDASIRRVVMSGRSEPLDVGRATPVVSPAMRRAVIVRDRHCRFPGCDRPHAWCDAHHVVHWADGGPTAVQNLVLLCRRHHRLVHDRTSGFSLRLLDDRPAFAGPDGPITEHAARDIEGRAPP